MEKEVRSLEYLEYGVRAIGVVLGEMRKLLHGVSQKRKVHAVGIPLGESGEP